MNASQYCSYGEHPTLAESLPRLYTPSTSIKSRDTCICSLTPRACKNLNKLSSLTCNEEERNILSYLLEECYQRTNSNKQIEIQSIHWKLLREVIGRRKDFPARKTERKCRPFHFHYLVRDGTEGLFSYIHDARFAENIYGKESATKFLVPDVTPPVWYVMPTGVLFPNQCNKRQQPHERTPGKSPNLRQIKQSRLSAMSALKRLGKSKQNLEVIHHANDDADLSSANITSLSPASTKDRTSTVNIESTIFSPPAKKTAFGNFIAIFSGRKKSRNTNGQERGRLSIQIVDQHDNRDKEVIHNSTTNCQKSGRGSNKQETPITEQESNHSITSDSNNLLTPNACLAESINAWRVSPRRKKNSPLPTKFLFSSDDKSIESMNLSSIDDTNSDRMVDTTLKAFDHSPKSLSSTSTSSQRNTNDSSNLSGTFERDGTVILDSSSPAKSSIRNEANVSSSLSAGTFERNGNVILDADSGNATEPDIPGLVDAIKTIREEIVKKKNTQNVHVNGLALDILQLHNPEENKTKSSVFSLSYVPMEGGNTRNSSISRLIQGKRKRHEGCSRTQELKNARTIESTLDVLCGGEDRVTAKRQVLGRVIKNMDGHVRWKKYALDLEDCLAIRQIGHLSGNNTYRILHAMSKLLVDERFFPSGLRDKLSKEEWLSSLRVELQSLEADVGTGKKKNCVFWWIPNYAYLLEKVASSSIIDGAYEDSFSFSNLKGTTIFLHGIDRGGPDLISCVRLVNRKDGNSGEYSLPTACFEGAHETFSNLKIANLNKERSRIFRLLIDEGSHMFHVRAKKQYIDTESEEPKMICDSRSIMIQFKSAFFSPKKLKVSIFGTQNKILSSKAELKQFYENSTHANSRNREMPDIVEINNQEMLSQIDEDQCNHRLNLIATLVFATDRDIALAKATTNDDLVRASAIPPDVLSMVGCKFESTYDVELYSFAYFSPIESIDLSTCESKVDCNRLALFNSDDGKMQTCVTGLGTASATFNCPRCCKRFDDTSLPSWCSDYRHVIGEHILYKDQKLREGTLSLAECEKRYEATVGKNVRYTYAEDGGVLSKSAIDTCFSVGEVLRHDLPNDIHGDPLHLHGGILTHLNELTLDMLKAVKLQSHQNTASEATEMTTGWAESKIEAAVVIAKQVSSLQKTEDYKLGAKSCKLLQKLQKEKAKEFEQVIADGSADEIIEMKRRELEDCTNKVEAAFELTGVGIMNMKIRGANKFLKLVGYNKTKAGKKQSKKLKEIGELNEAEYLFKQAVRTYAGQFLVQHGPVELTCIRGMLALERRQDIARAVSAAYAETDQEANHEVKKIMDWFLEIAEHLYEMGLLMKSQQKMTEERIKKLELHIANYLKLWYAKFEELGLKKSPLFWKLHVLLCCFVQFCRKYGIGGRASTEGFENVHFWLNKLRALMAPVVNTRQRVSKISQRNQMFLHSGLQRKLKKVKNATKNLGKKRGPYKTSKLAKNQEDIVVGDTSDDVQIVNVPGFSLTGEGDLLPESVIDLENLLQSQKVPASFYSYFSNNDDLGGKAKLEVQHHV